MKDVAIIGAGIAGIAIATRLQKLGYSTQLFEAHGQPGGCAGFYRRRGFSFDVGATTLVDFGPGGVGGEWLSSIAMPPIEWEQLPGYLAWLPDRTVTLHRDPALWNEERLNTLGCTPAHHAFWMFIDRLAAAFWQASRRGVKLPIQSIRDAVRDVRALGAMHLPLIRYLNWTVEDALRAFGLHQDRALTSLLAMLIEDTVHSSVREAPLINAALGISIRGAGLTRARGGMRGFWQALTTHYRTLGGELRVGCRVEQITGERGKFYIRTRRGEFQAAQVVSTLPASLTSCIAPTQVARTLSPYLSRNANALGGALCVFLGVPEQEVCEQDFRHHQLLQTYNSPLGDGNNMFISVSAPGDTESAPTGYRSVMLSTHCSLEPWEALSASAYQAQKRTSGDHLISLARRVYPHLAEQASVYEVATPRSYQFFTFRPRGAVGGFRLTLYNANQRAIPYSSGVPGFWLAGDTTWPGLGTVACVLGSKIVAEQVAESARYLQRPRWFLASFLQGGAEYARS
ncbi:NAD(P)/FAD-dependent oxidoreductase [Ktedonobacter sp. SOSP1-52]|uniref:phytoene desaturase family protein n=1 Tax=Ktedonobacter sp. SOSP1-52 TaxID=2778366 RepID=UPI00191522D5|nr:NAD(P)/FAD-dependent oxidoreductase [Ktedonobacter sp. SOSP1-52]